MYRTLMTLALFAFVISTLIVTTPTPAAAAPASCNDLAAYQRAVFGAVDRDDVEWFLALDLEKARPSQLARLATIFDDWATELEAMPIRDVPMVARDYHETFIDMVSVYSAMFNSMVVGGIFGALPYMDAVEQITADLDTANRNGVRNCGSLWPFEDGPSTSQI